MSKLVTNVNGSTVNRSVGERSDRRRKRKLQQLWKPGAVATDGKGNIIVSPLERPICFADPVEWVRGCYDKPNIWNGKEQAKGCAGCPVRAFCATVAWERIQTSPSLNVSYTAWEAATVGDDRYTHPTYAVFVDASDRQQWTDCFEDSILAATQSKRAGRASTRLPNRTVAKPRPRSVPKAIANSLAKERDRRERELLDMGSKPSSPLWARNRAPDRLVLIADAWYGRALLEEGNRQASGRAVAAWLVAEGRAPGPLPNRFVKTVEEALSRADTQWPEWFDPSPPKSPRQVGHGMHPATVIRLLEDENLDGGFTL